MAISTWTTLTFRYLYYILFCLGISLTIRKVARESPPAPPVVSGRFFFFLSYITTTAQISGVNRASAVAAESDIVWPNLARTVGYRASAAAELRQAAIAVYGIRWNRAVITAIANNRNNHVLALLRNSGVPLNEYARLSDFLYESYSEAFSAPPELEEWRPAAAQLLLELPRGWGSVVHASISLRPHGILKPFEMGVLTPSESQPISDGFQNAALPLTLRTASRAISPRLYQVITWYLGVIP